MKKTLSVILTVLMLVSLVPVAVFADGEEIVITEDGNYTVGSVEALTVDGANVVITLSDSTINGVGRSAVILKNGANVIFVLEGSNTINGDADVPSCGIEVRQGTTATFTGKGTLNVTGGKYGAGIGSYGRTRHSDPTDDGMFVGSIVINDGVIIAHGGHNGSGIGSGARVQGAGYIEINGGLVNSFGTTGGAGIGTGYGTSGGANELERVGDIGSGTIVINGGDVFAAAYDLDIASFSYDDLAALNSLDQGTFAAGIGGGYGASANNVQIKGGTVMAIGSCGGAGIGAGRGTSKTKNYNPDTYESNVTIGGDAVVTAVTSDNRANEINSGGAAIGSGRGSHTGGNVIITDRAQVTAISATQAPAIGASKQKSPVDGSIPVAQTIVIGDNVNLFAASAGSYAVDTEAVDLYIDEHYFGSTDNFFFGGEATPIDDVNEATVASNFGSLVYNAPVGTVSVWSRIADVSAPADIDEPIVPDEPDEPVTGDDTAVIRIDVPLKMAVAFEDGTIYYGGEMKEVEVGREYAFQMCSVNWDNGVYDEEGNGIAGTVVYRMKVVHQDEFNELAREAANNPERYTVKGIDIIDNEAKTIIVNCDAEDAHLETDVNNFFMAYRFHFTGEDYDKKTGIANVVNNPLESLSVNLPLGSTITCDAYIGEEMIDTTDLFVANNSGEGEYEDEFLTSVNDYTWNY